MNENIKKILDTTRLHLSEDQEKTFETFVREFIDRSVDVMCQNDYHGEWLGEKIREHFGITESARSAEGQKGFLIRTIDGELLFRVYSDDGEYQDYSIAHQDLEVTITDKHAYLYRRGDNYTLDYSPEVLGKNNENNNSN